MERRKIPKMTGIKSETIIIYIPIGLIELLAIIKWSEGEIENGYFSIERMMMIFNR